jgi:AmmeMemoRadiSam system protein A
LIAKLDDAARQALLRRARGAIAVAIGMGPESGIGEPPTTDPHTPIAVGAGAFVTLRMRGELRGCIGYPASELSLNEVVERCAVSAALDDPRFPALSASEWQSVELEISVLGPLEPVSDVSEIEIGRHGLIAELGQRRGLLLPQVAVEWNWDRTEFVSHTCAKAGLPRDAWQHGATLYKFEADVFGET